MKWEEYRRSCTPPTLSLSLSKLWFERLPSSILYPSSLPRLLDCFSTCLRECIFLCLPVLLPVNQPFQMRTKCPGCWCNLTGSGSITIPRSRKRMFLWICWARNLHSKDDWISLLLTAKLWVRFSLVAWNHWDAVRGLNCWKSNEKSTQNKMNDLVNNAWINRQPCRLGHGAPSTPHYLKDTVSRRLLICPSHSPVIAVGTTHTADWREVCSPRAVRSPKTTTAFSGPGALLSLETQPPGTCLLRFCCCLVFPWASTVMFAS